LLYRALDLTIKTYSSKETAQSYKYIQGVENESDVDIIMFDLAKAFDSVNHDLLLIKLGSYEFGKNVFTWLSDFLFLRQQS
jgi:hypothetical protein